MSAESQQSSVPPPVPFRAATTSDAERLARAMADELEGDRSFAPRG